MKRIVITGLSLALALFLVTAVALAWGPRFGPGFAGGPPIPNLTEEQSSQIQALQQAHLKEIAPLQQDLLTKRTELCSLWIAQNADPSVLTAKQKEIWDLLSNLQEMTNNLRLKIREVLTPEQQAQFDTFGPRRGMGPRMGRGPGPEFGPGSFSSGGGFSPGFGPQNQ